MMFSRKLAESMAKNSVIEHDEIDIYCFGIQIVTETIFSFVVFLVISLLFHCIIETTVFMLSFALLRQYAGGFHTDKFISCLLISCGVITIFCILIHLPDIVAYFIGALAMISLIVILWLSPVDSKYKPISNSDKKKYRKKLVVILLMEIIITAVIMLYSVHFAMCIVFSWIVLALLLIIGQIQNKHNS